MTKKAWFIGLLLGILLILASVVITVVLGTLQSNDPNRRIIGNADFWYAYYFHKTLWMRILGGCVGAVFSAMFAIRKK